MEEKVESRYLCDYCSNMERTYEPKHAKEGCDDEFAVCVCRGTLAKVHRSEECWDFERKRMEEPGENT